MARVNGELWLSFARLPLGFRALLTIAAYAAAA